MTDGNDTQRPDVTPGSIGNPEDIAAAFFKKEKPHLKLLLTKMSAKQLRRFVMNVAAFPLVDPGDLPKTPEEKQAAYIFSEMTLNKSLMILAAEMKKAEEAIKQKEKVNEENS